MNNLEKEMALLLKEHELPYDSLSVYGTPRRLSIIVKNLAGGTHTQKKVKKGPAISVAFDAEGQPTKAGMGFFRSIGLEPLSLEVAKKTESLEIQNDYLFATIEKSGLSTRALLANALAQLILKIDFPKKMRWGQLDIEYARPLRWIVALYGKDEIPFVLGDLVSSKISYGHPGLAPEPFSLSHPSSYVDTLKKRFVLVDVKERKETILEQIHGLERKKNGQVVAQERVMAQVLHLTEWPLATLGEFDSAFLKAPKEVLISEMVEHQKYFPLAKEDGTLLPCFIVVCNNTPSDLIRSGHQKALAPRLADGAFLYDEDLKSPLELFRKKLEAITFQKELGSMAEKAKRLISNVDALHTHLPLCDLEKIKRAAELCKADLASELVGEFPDLQGTAGRLYALHHGEDPLIATAIEEHWMPHAEKAPLPTTPMGTLLSIADKIDNLLSCFALGLIPTSASDPYALRRQTLGMLKMLITSKMYLPLPTMLNHAIGYFCKNPSLAPKTKQKIEQEKASILEAMLTFITARLRTVLSEHGFAKDEIEAVLFRNLQNPYSSYRLIEALHTFRQKSHKQFLSILACFTRVKKILFSQNAKMVPGWRASDADKNRYPSVNPKLLVEPQEKVLWEKAKELEKQFHLSLLDRRDPQTHDYATAFALLGELITPVSAFFDTVMVLDKDPALRTNRLALLQTVWDLFEELVDFGKLQELDK